MALAMLVALKNYITRLYSSLMWVMTSVVGPTSTTLHRTERFDRSSLSEPRLDLDDSLWFGGPAAPPIPPSCCILLSLFDFSLFTFFNELKDLPFWHWTDWNKKITCYLQLKVCKKSYFICHDLILNDFFEKVDWFI